MPFPFSGLLLIVHFLIIGIAAIINFFRGDKLQSAFQTYGKGGGVVKNVLINRIIALFILIAVSFYLFSLLFTVLTMGLASGASEPQVIFVKHFVATVATGLAVVISDSVFQVLAVSGFIVFLLGFIHINRSVVLNKISMSKAKVGVIAGVEKIKDTFSDYVVKLSTLIFGIVAGILVFSAPLFASAQIVEPGFESGVVAGGFSLATAVAFAPDGRIFVTEKSGTVKIVKDGVVLPNPLVSLTDVNTFGDRGLLGIAVDPNFSTNGYIYLSYTYENSPGTNVASSKTARIVRLTVVGDTASESSKVVLVGTVGGSAAAPSCEDFAVTADCIPSDSSSHSAGGLRFGPDGYLYATLGDGADFAAVDPRALRAQNIDSLAGKVLRINTDGTAPADNPFYDGNPNSNRSKVYALGFRNMFRFNFDPKTGKMYGGDVGWSSWEEMNEVKKGANYGWPCIEGNSTTSYACSPSSTSTSPLYTYPHNSAGAGSITAGAFFSNSAYPANYETSILIGDYAQMWLKRMVLDAAGNLVSVENFSGGMTWPVEITNGLDGSIYYLDIVTGNLMRVTHTNGNRRPVVQLSANPISGLTPLSVDFSTAGTADPDGDAITYAWDFGDGSTSTEANPTHIYNSNGSYLASVTVTDTFGAVAAKSITITAGNQAPQAKIVSPASGSLYKALESVAVSGDGTDPEDGTLPASAFAWTVLLHHNTHTHTVQQFSGVKDINFIADDHNDPDVYMEIILTVTDSAGLTSSQSINMYLDNGIGSGNLISNPSLETEGALAGTPLDWVQSWYGVMNPIYTYPVAGLAGSKAAKVEILDYQSGSAKWAFSPVFVTPGAEYTFKNQYTANIPSDLTAQFIRPDGTATYQYLATVPATSTPTTNTINFIVPSGIQTVTIFHEIYGIGQLVVDDYSLTLAASGDVTPPTGTITNIADGDVISGVVSVEVNATDNVGVASVHLEVDGTEVGVGDSEPPFAVSWDTTSVADGTYTLAGHIHDTAGNTANTPSINVTVNNSGTTTATTTNNLVVNGDFETAGPTGWHQGGWGTNNPVFTYPTPGNTGNGAKVAITNYTDGDAKWYFDDVAVTGGKDYSIGDSYNSTIATDVLVRYTMADSSVQYAFVQALPSTGGAWQTFSGTVTTPANAVSMTLFHLIAGVGELTIDDVKVVDPNSTSTADTTPPTVSITSLTDGQEITGTVFVNADVTDNVGVSFVQLFVDGKSIRVDGVSPYSLELDTTAYANGNHAVFIEATDVNQNSAQSDVVNVIVNNSSTTPDTAGPSVDIVPGNLSDITGIKNVRIEATDLSGITNVEFYLLSPDTLGPIDGTYFTSSSSPYIFEFDSTVVSDGTYTVVAKATDGVGNSSDKAVGWKIVNDSAVFYTNIVSNGDLENNAGNGSPSNWHQGGWGTNNPVFTYPTPGNTGNGAKVAITNYTDGDAKWYFDDVAVTGGKDYSIGDSYNSTIATDVLVRYTMADSSVQYAFVQALPSTGGAWQTFSGTVTTPANAVSMTLFHLIAGVGELTIDDVKVVDPSGATDVVSPTVNVKAPSNGDTVSGLVNVQVTAIDNVGISDINLLVDGVQIQTTNSGSPHVFVWDSNTVTNGLHTISATAHDTDGQLGSSVDIDITVDNSTTMPPPVGVNLIQNGDFEQVGADGNPVGWTPAGWGSHTRVFNYPVAGSDGGNGAEVVITSYTALDDGDAKWAPAPVAVTPGVEYTYTTKYKAGTISDVIGRYQFADGSEHYFGVIKEIPAAANWTQISGKFVPPANVVNVTLYHLISTVTTLTIDEVGLFETGTGTPSEINPPVVEFINPLQGDTISGTITLTASSSDDTAVAGVFFAVDGTPLAAEDTTAPYEFVWDSTTVADGAHILKATTRDPFGNNAKVEITVTVDNSTTTPPTDTTAPTVSLTSPVNNDTVAGNVSVNVTANDNVAVAGVTLLIDGTAVLTEDTTAPYTFAWDSTTVADGVHTISATARDAAGNVGTATNISVTVANSTPPPVGNNLVLNSDLENDAGNGNPTNWHQGGWGTNDRVLTYPVAGNGGNGAKVAIANYTDGDAKWYFDDVAVTGGATYTIGDDYSSTIASQVVVRYTLADNSFQYELVQNLPSTGGAWNSFSQAISVPANAVSLTVFHLIAGVGELAIDNVSVL
ncbi:MAG: PQQ-dependent sugar dehydrogenase [Candidatus Nomurabacteria bacterium]|nr:PQQ-dependent sugar dehydrogenase [Candidatus Nomurabacteria bacterium]USN88021.1 MAG: PQQ-dependent sugar dehydrogenase [Candidatus Nomurabacteria bacterium]